MLIAMIVAMDNDSSIGQNGGLPWKLSSDIKRFKKITQGEGYNAVIMGRKTWNSLPSKYRPLSGRINIVMSRDSDWSDEGAWNALYPGRAIEIAYSEGCEECWIIGGAQIYEMFLEHVNEIHVTTVHTSDSGSIRFPHWNRDSWTEERVEETEIDERNEFRTTYSVWKRQ